MGEHSGREVEALGEKRAGRRWVVGEHLAAGVEEVQGEGVVIVGEGYCCYCGSGLAWQRGMSWYLRSRRIGPDRLIV